MKTKRSPAYLQVKKKLIRFFEDNDFSQGDKLPTEFELMQLFAVSRTTIRKALQVLNNQGLVDKSQGKGTFYTGRTNSSETRGTKRLGLSNYFFMDYIYSDIVKGIEREIQKSGYSLIIANSHSCDEKQFEAVKQLIDGGIDGLILEPAHNLLIQKDHQLIQLLESVDIPVVTTHWGINLKSVSTVTLHDEKAGRVAARYLLDCGHRRIAAIFKNDIQPGFDRLCGFTAALEEAGFPLDQNLCYTYTNQEELANDNQGYRLTRKMLQDNPSPPTVVFYFNDGLAVQSYKAVREAGLTIPDDISLLGFDDYSSASIVTPGLTTFSHPKYNLGRWVAKILLDKIEHNFNTSALKLVFEPQLVERESVKVITTEEELV